MANRSIQGGEVSWKPPADVRDCTGRELSPGLDFFVRPPPEVGTVRLAVSDVREGQTLYPSAIKIGLAALVCVAGGLGLRWTNAHRLPGQKPNLLEVVIFLASLVLPIMAVAYAFAKKRYVGYVGDKGAALFSTKGTRNDATGKVFEFERIADIQIEKKGQSKGTIDWEMRFVDAAGNVSDKLRGNVKIFFGKTVGNTMYAFAAATRKAWLASHGREA